MATAIFTVGVMAVVGDDVFAAAVSEAEEATVVPTCFPAVSNSANCTVALVALLAVFTTSALAITSAEAAVEPKVGCALWIRSKWPSAPSLPPAPVVTCPWANIPSDSKCTAGALCSHVFR